MIAWITAWNAAYGVGLSTSTTSILTLKQRWDLIYTGTPFASLGQISAGGRPSGLLLDGCSRTRINGLRGNNCVALINDQGGTRTGEDVYGFGTHVDSIEMPDDVRFGYLGKGVAITIDEVRGNTNGTRDTGGAPHAVYVAGSPDQGNVNTALQIKSVQAREWGIGPFIKAREASLALGPMVAERVQSILGLVHCTGYVGPITSLDQILNRDENGDEVTSSGSKYTANFTRCYDMQVARMGVQHRASTGLVSQDSLRVADINGCSGMTFDGFDVNCHRLSDGPAMVRLSLTTDSSMGPSSLVNTGTNDVYLYEGGLSGEIGGSNGGSNGGLSFDVVRCSAKAKIADLGGATRNSRFTVDTRLLTDGYEDDDTIRDDSFGASNNINFVVGERIVPLSAAPSFLTRAYDSLLLSYTEDEESDDDTILNYANGETVTIDGVVITAVNTLTANNQFVIGAEASDSQKNLRALVNYEVTGRGTTYQAAAAHATYFGAASGREFVAINNATGAAGNGDVMSTTSTRAAWNGGVSANGGLVDAKLLNSLLDMTAGSSGITVPLPDHTLVPVGSRIAVRKADSASGYVYIRNAAGATIATIKKVDRIVRLVADAGGWTVDSTGDEFAAEPSYVRDTSLPSRTLADENLYFLVGNNGLANAGALRAERMPFSALKPDGSSLDIKADAETWQIVDPSKNVRTGHYYWNTSGAAKIYDLQACAYGEVYEFNTSATSTSTLFMGTEGLVVGLNTAGATIELPAATRIALRRQTGSSFYLIDYTALTSDATFRYVVKTLTGGGAINPSSTADMLAINLLDSTAGACIIQAPSPTAVEEGEWITYVKTSADSNVITVERDGSGADIAYLTTQGDRITLRMRVIAGTETYEIDSLDVAPAARATGDVVLHYNTSTRKTTYGEVRLAPTAFASLPAASSYNGATVLVTDVGVDGGSIWVSNGSIWAPTGPVMLARSAVQSAGQLGPLAETTVQSVMIPAGVMGTNRSLRVDHTWSMPASANAKTYRARLSTSTSPAGALINSTAAASTTVTTALMGRIANRNSASSQVANPTALSGGVGNTIGAVATGSINTANASYVVFTAELAAAETVYLERYQVELLP